MAESGAPFAHLHVHTEYSMLDGAARLKDLFAEVKSHGMTHVAMTDHGNMYGAAEFHRQAKDAGITPVIGIEAYVAPESRSNTNRILWGQPHQKKDDVSASGAYLHKTIWARNSEGLHNLFRLSSRSYAEGWLVKWPRMDKEILSEHAGGLMASTGCPSGELQTRLRLGQFDEALAAAAEWRDIFGKENYFLELMDHGLDIERRVRDGLVEIGKKLAIPPVVTNDSHYTREPDAQSHDLLLCIQTGKSLADADRFRFDGSGYFIKPAAQMYAIDQSDMWQEGCRNSQLLVADRVDASGMFDFVNLMPRFPIPEGFESEDELFRAEVWKGMERRYPNGYDDRRRQQAEYEIGIICQMGFPAYFLVVADFIMWAKNNGVAVGPGRGSAAGSIVAYAMGITDLDPLDHGLIFERFLNPERVSMPDIDIDFDERGRADVIRYVTQKWGADRVAQIVTYGTIKAKAAIKDSCRVLGHPYALGDRITKAFPAAVMGKDIPLSGIFDESHPRYKEAGELRSLYESEAEIKQVIDTARGIEGLIRQPGVHAAGVIMSAETLTDHIPVWTRHTDGAVITQFDYPTCEGLGLLKMDFLGLRNLTIMADAVAAIEKNRDVSIDLLSLPLDDKATYELLGRGDTLGVFQFDGGPMRSLLRMMKPDNFEDISAVGALYRPGPMGVNSHTNYALRKNGQQEITPIHPELEEPLREVLEPTYGLIVYQEQVQKAAQILAGVHARTGGPAPPGHGQEEKRDPGQGVRALPGGLPGARLLGQGDPGRLGCPGAVRGLRVQQSPLGRLRPGVLLDRLPEGQLPGRVHVGPAHQRRRRQGQVRALPQRVPPDGHQGAAAGRERVGSHLRGGRRGRQVRPGRDPQRRRQRSRGHHRRPQVQGRVHRLLGLLAQGPAGGVQQACDRVADQGGRVRRVQG